MRNDMKIAGIRISDKFISASSMPYVIAEIGVNHEGSIERAKKLIELAYEGGADAVKFQTYKAETLASKNSPSYWDLSKEATRSQYELFKKHDSFGKNEFDYLAEFCCKIGVDFMSTPFDEIAVDYLTPLIPCFKIASGDITNFPLLRKIASKQKPVLLSTGASTLAEIEMALIELEEYGAKSVALLHCVLNYPVPYENTHLNMIESLCKVFPDHVIGYSDHTVPDENMLILTTAYLKGAMIIEKHFTDDKSLTGNDHYHSMDVIDLKRFKKNLTLLNKAEGQIHKAPLSDETLARKNARRSIVLKRSLNKGELITQDALTCKRPAFGISPVHWDEIIGKTVDIDLPEDHILQWHDFI